MNSLIFREYDIRGIAEEDLTDEVAQNIGRAFGTVLRRSGGTTVALGHDIRLSSSPRFIWAPTEACRSPDRIILRSTMASR